VSPGPDKEKKAEEPLHARQGGGRKNVPVFVFDRRRGGGERWDMARCLSFSASRVSVGGAREKKKKGQARRKDRWKKGLEATSCDATGSGNAGKKSLRSGPNCGGLVVVLLTIERVEGKKKEKESRSPREVRKGSSCFLFDTRMAGRKKGRGATSFDASCSRRGQARKKKEQVAVEENLFS